MNQEDIRTLNELKMLSIDMITHANGGSPGITLSIAPIVYTLFHRHLNIRPNEPEWINRDRVIACGGEITSIIYAALYMAGFPITREDLLKYREIKSNTPGFFEYKRTPGIEATTGLSGSGIGIAVGLSLARRFYKNIIEKEDDRLKLIDYTVYCFCTESDMMEGIASEACSFAGAQKLDNLVLLYNATNITEDGSLENTIQEDVVKKYQSLGFYVDHLKDATNIKDIDKSIAAAKKSGRPALIIFQTILGKESFNENKNIIYNRPLTPDDVANLRKKWNLFLPPFEISKDSIIFFQKNITERTNKKYQKWLEMYKKAESNANPIILNALKSMVQKDVAIDFDSEHYKINDNYRESLIDSNLKVMNLFGSKTNLFLGGSADFMLSCQTYLNGEEIQSSRNPLGRNIRFGKREHAMGAILNGLSLSGLRVYGSTKLVYADYLKSQIRLSSIMDLPVTFIFTHDTISVGEEGPTMEAIEQLSMLHTIPNLTCYRPGDIMELMGSWEVILKNTHPSALILTQNSLPKLPGSNAKQVSKGAYIIKHEKNKLDGILLSSGSELVYALQLSYDLEQHGLDIRVVSIPSLELFLSEGKEYEKSLLPDTVKKIVIEAGNPLIWNRFTEKENIIGIEEFGYSGRSSEVLKEMGFDYETLKVKVLERLK